MKSSWLSFLLSHRTWLTARLVISKVSIKSSILTSVAAKVVWAQLLIQKLLQSLFRIGLKDEQQCPKELCFKHDCFLFSENYKCGFIFVLALFLIKLLGIALQNGDAWKKMTVKSTFQERDTQQEIASLWISRMKFSLAAGLANPKVSIKSSSIVWKPSQVLWSKQVRKNVSQISTSLSVPNVKNKWKLLETFGYIRGLRSGLFRWF